jgi:hypothetical protein
MSSFEAVLGPKTDRWLVYTVSGLLVTIGAAQLTGYKHAAPQARQLGIGAAATLTSIDVLFVGKRRISRNYLLDALFEVGLLGGWLRSRATRRAALTGR